ncbi:MAG: small multi-drug export protein [Patescibacteria group bacterium]|nr:small multi-drug export protein [Patescibacteria group bacterium]
MISQIIQFFSNFDPHWAVFFLSMIPLTELRASIPIGLEVYHLAIWKVWLIAVAGDFLPALFLLWVFPKLHDFLIKSKLFGKIFSKKLKQAEKAFSGDYAKYGALGLIIFIGIPLPMTGSWTGSLVAFIFGIPLKKSWPLILAGVCIAATIVTLITLFAGETIRAIFG